MNELIEYIYKITHFLTDKNCMADKNDSWEQKG